MPILQKTQLTPLPAMQSSATTPLLTEIERKIKDDIITFLIVEQGRFPARLRMNPCTILEMPSSQWHTFHAIVYGETIEIPVVADPRLKHGDICLDPAVDDVATRAMEAVVTG